MTFPHGCVAIYYHLIGIMSNTELQSKWDKAFWDRGCYVSTIGNITEEAIKKYIRMQAEESRKEDLRSTIL